MLFSLGHTGPTVLGSNGLITVPSAYLYEDGTILLGYKYESETFPHYRNSSSPLKEPGIIGAITYLPFLEVSFRYNLEPFTDRLANIRLKLYDETKYIPTVTIGLRDGLTLLRGVKNTEGYGEEQTSYYNTVYLVTSKTFELEFLDIKQILSLTIGGGYSDFENSKHKHLHGIFGGIEWQPLKSIPIALMADYDTKEFGLGISTKLFDHFYGSFSTREFQSFAFIIATSVNI